MWDHLLGRPVLVRSDMGGVFLGTLLAAWDDGTLRLRARRMWDWAGALDSTVLAAQGPGEATAGPESDILLRPAAQVVELLPMTAEAVAALAEIPIWRR